MAARVVAAARGWVGTPGVHRASLRGAGCDCLGLVRGVWREIYGAAPEEPPAYGALWAEAGGGEALHEGLARHLRDVPVSEARAGDVVLFRFRDDAPAKHAAILTAADRMVHAYGRGGVVEGAIVPWWRRRLVAAFRFPKCPPHPFGALPPR